MLIFAGQEWAGPTQERGTKTLQPPINIWYISTWLRSTGYVLMAVLDLLAIAGDILNAETFGMVGGSGGGGHTHSDLIKMADAMF